MASAGAIPSRGSRRPGRLARPLTAEQFRAAHWNPRERLPATPQELRELLGRGYTARWLDLAARIVLEDLGEDLPDRRWVVPTRARHHWLELFAHWRDRRGDAQAV
ncbi:hypothetical protein [Kitasatospora sp. NBC_01302]|uniref:hypothetical protein n=1 Tax=Kitasatospora sp. NBC_01302 TaxID=2903575 RepID=UPI002E13373C|nr:hypothetical protein OG294_40710 [Kitasatospora sp. NBC_01302]